MSAQHPPLPVGVPPAVPCSAALPTRTGPRLVVPQEVVVIVLVVVIGALAGAGRPVPAALAALAGAAAHQVRRAGPER
jgi:hypothetical protein